jgi:hypothetical protein
MDELNKLFPIDQPFPEIHPNDEDLPPPSTSLSLQLSPVSPVGEPASAPPPVPQTRGPGGWVFPVSALDRIRARSKEFIAATARAAKREAAIAREIANAAREVADAAERETTIRTDIRRVTANVVNNQEGSAVLYVHDDSVPLPDQVPVIDSASTRGTVPAFGPRSPVWPAGQPQDAIFKRVAEVAVKSKLEKVMVKKRFIEHQKVSEKDKKRFQLAKGEDITVVTIFSYKP